MKLFRFISALAILSLLFSCKSEEQQPKNLTQSFEFRKDTLLGFIQNKDTLANVFEIELAQTDFEKETGLMHRKEMKSNQGMLFIYDNEAARPSFYMKNTFIPLDLIYLDKNMKIVDFNLNTAPLSEDLIPSEIPSRYVLEVNAGIVNEFKIKEGDQVFLK